MDVHGKSGLTLSLKMGGTKNFIRKTKPSKVKGA